MNPPRKPAAFRLDPEPSREEMTAKPKQPAVEATRKPRAVKVEVAIVTPAEIDVFDQQDLVVAEPPPAAAPRRRSKIGAIFLGALGILVSLAVGLWTDRLIRDLFERAEWLGWLAAGVAVVAALALVLILLRETLALLRLASVEKLRSHALDAIARDDPKAARTVVDELTVLVVGMPETAAGRRMLGELRDDIIDGGNLVRLAETEIFGP